MIYLGIYLFGLFLCLMAAGLITYDETHRDTAFCIGAAFLWPVVVAVLAVAVVAAVPFWIGRTIAFRIDNP